MTRRQFENLKTGDFVGMVRSGALRKILRASRKLHYGKEVCLFIEMRKLHFGGKFPKNENTLYGVNDAKQFNRVYTKKKGGEQV